MQAPSPPAFKTGLNTTMNLFRRILLPFAATTLLLGVAVAQTTPPAPSHPPAVPRPVVPEAPVPPPPDVDGKSWVLMDYATGQILASKEPDLRVEPASITKIMTDYVVSAELGNGNTDQQHGGGKRNQATAEKIHRIVQSSL